MTTQPLPPGGSPVCPSCGRESVYQGYGPFWRCYPLGDVPGCRAFGDPLTFCVHATPRQRLESEGHGLAISNALKQNQTARLLGANIMREEVLGLIREGWFDGLADQIRLIDAEVLISKAEGEL